MALEANAGERVVISPVQPRDRGVRDVDYSAFESVYRQVAREIMAHWTDDMQTEIARHNIEWDPGISDFHSYLVSSVVRFFKAYRALLDSNVQCVCDVGGFLGVFPVTLTRLGFRVTMSETRQYYSGAFDPIFAVVEAAGVAIQDYDLFSEMPGEVEQRFDAVTLMAVLEHYPHSHRQAMQNICHLLHEKGKLYVEVPNIAYWPKRWGLLRGKSPLVSIAAKFRSEVPFIGHHHEFTEAHLKELMQLAGFAVLQTSRYNISQPRIDSYRELARRTFSLGGWGENISALIFHLFPNTRECLSMLCTLRGRR